MTFKKKLEVMYIETPVGKLHVVNEPTYTLGSSDNARKYPVEKNLSPMDRPSSIHGLLLNGAPLAVLANSGGASGVHEHSVFFFQGSLYLALGDSVVSLNLSPLKVSWVLKVDEATCFGVYCHQPHAALISHGELSIARFSSDGRVIWSAFGEDIFSEGFALHENFVEAIDFENRSYKFNYRDGKQSV
jgi:hypothetical protein